MILQSHSIQYIYLLTITDLFHILAFLPSGKRVIAFKPQVMCINSPGKCRVGQIWGKKRMSKMNKSIIAYSRARVLQDKWYLSIRKPSCLDSPFPPNRQINIYWLPAMPWGMTRIRCLAGKCTERTERSSNLFKCATLTEFVFTWSRLCLSCTVAQW